MARIFIEGSEYEVRDGVNLLDACLSLGFDIPYFCWHPAMGSVGACRLCAVKKFSDENDTRGRIVMSCMEPVADGLRISIDDPEVKEHRASVIEWLMINHPHDCPVCDEGGECHLQDMTVMTGHRYRRYRFRKRTHHNQYLGPFINHEMNRCIQCYRCVRFYRDYAGGRDFNVFASHDHVYFGRHREGVLESEFSGNLVEVCPTGVFTDRTLYRHYTRKWDMQSSPSICPHCSLGCNTFVGERYGMIRRVLNRYNGMVNGHFLCDRGRFGYEFVNGGNRARAIRLRSGKGAAPEEAGLDKALSRLGDSLKKGRIIGIGSPRASLESNFALRSMVGPENFFSGMNAVEHGLVSLVMEIVQNTPAKASSLKDTESADAVLVLGEDVTGTAPMLALSLRQAVKNRAVDVMHVNRVPRWDSGHLCKIVQEESGPFFILSAHPTGLDDIATEAYRAAPATLAGIGNAIAARITGKDAPSEGLTPGEWKLAERIARQLLDAASPLVVSGTGLSSGPVLDAAAAVARALAGAGRKPALFLTVPECNSLGAAMLAGRNIDDALDTVEESGEVTAVILENDLYRRAPRARVDSFLGRCSSVIVLDTIETLTGAGADIFIPVAPYTESDGTYINSECRAQRFFRVMDPQHDARTGWRWLSDMQGLSGKPGAVRWENMDGITASIIKDLPFLAPLGGLTPAATMRLEGQGIPRQPHRYSGRTSMNAQTDIHERRPPRDVDSPLVFSMEGQRHPFTFDWAPGWNSVQSLYRDRHGTEGFTGVRITPPREAYAGAAFGRGGTGDGPPGGEFLMVPYVRVFGSEELSAGSPSIMERMARPYILLNDADAARLGAAGGTIVTVKANGSAVRLSLQVSGDVPVGLACYPRGMPGVDYCELPAFGTIEVEE